MIIGGESSSRGRKRPQREVYTTQTGPSMTTITITLEDGLYVRKPYNDALVINTHIRNYLVKRMLVDDGSAVYVLTWDAFQEMGGSSVELKPITNLMTSFCGGTVRPMGSIELEIELGDSDS